MKPQGGNKALKGAWHNLPHPPRPLQPITDVLTWQATAQYKFTLHGFKTVDLQGYGD